MFVSLEPKRSKTEQNNYPDQDQISRSEEVAKIGLEDPGEATSGQTDTGHFWNVAAFVDKISIIAFPMLYIGFNIFYWSYYM